MARKVIKMSFAQGTQNYDLPQYVATDVPSWITDITNAFQKNRYANET